MKMRSEKVERGLPSLNQARQRRRRAIVLGRVSVREAAPRLWLWIFVVIAAFAVIYWRYAEGALATQKSQVMAKQRAIANLLGPKIIPFRERVEAWVIELGQPWSQDTVAPGVTIEEVSRGPSVYLRLISSQASNVEELRKGAQGSVRDGFTSCLFASKTGYDPTRGDPCRTVGDCSAGKLCSEYGVCAPPGDPFNMRLAYRALRILSSEWSDELNKAQNDLAVRAFERDLEQAAENAVPIAIDVLSRSKFFTVLLDEPASPEVEAEALAEAVDETPLERLQRLPHVTRIGIWDLETQAAVLKLRTSATGAALAVTGRAVTEQKTLLAQQRQVNNCALAMTVREALGSGTK